ncbi:MAG: hypothetical protein A2X94_13430 [Bdellovibrionales bacterium GWB1_55_8]|nr:MAG: hypothetical protein A2X94_13430 [Bdellovibrionales bacterium GWB1_55_8]
MAVVALIVAAPMMGCRSSSHHTSVISDPYQPMWYDVYGRYCGTGTPSAGCNYYSNGLKIIDIEDPYFNNYYNLEYAYWEYYDEYGYLSYYLGWAWLSPNDILYNENGRALNETGNEEGRDIVAEAGEQQESAIMGAGKQFASRYALADSVGVRIARTLNDWATLAKSRSRTEQDIADFSKRLYGVDYTQVTSALAKAAEGDKTEINVALGEMADYWGTTPETSREIVKGAYKDVLGDFNP